MRPATVHEHRSDQGSIHRDRCGLQYPGSDIMTFSDLFRNSGERVGEMFIGTGTLEGYKDQYIHSDQCIVDERRNPAIGIVITYWKHRGSFYFMNLTKIPPNT